MYKFKYQWVFATTTSRRGNLRVDNSNDKNYGQVKGHNETNSLAMIYLNQEGRSRA